MNRLPINEDASKISQIRPGNISIKEEEDKEGLASNPDTIPKLLLGGIAPQILPKFV